MKGIGPYFDFHQLPGDFLPEEIDENFGVVQIVPHTCKVNVEKCHLLFGTLHKLWL